MYSVTEERLQAVGLNTGTILDHIGCPVCLFDVSDQEVLFYNSGFEALFQQALETGMIGPRLEQLVMQEQSGSHTEFYHEISGAWYELNYNQFENAAGVVTALYAFHDVTEKKSYQRRAENQSSNDFLTGLYNRICCERDLQRLIQEAQEEGKKGALLYLDLDNFKYINAGLGHHYGDLLLQKISAALREIEDIADACYRTGGDEFVILISPSRFARLDLIIDEVKGVFAHSFTLRGKEYYCTMSMGIVLFPEEQKDDAEDLIKKADIAMYDAKNNGKNRIAYYENEVGNRSIRRLDLEKNMRADSTGDFRAFEVYYQPIMDIQKEGRPCVGAEALIRWNSTEMGFVSPADFIPLAEYLGLINPIGNFVLKKACQECRYWNLSGYPEYKVNVNLSLIQLLQPDIVESVEQVLEETGLNPANLTLEVTEGLAINDMARMKNILEGIRRLGVRIALDDFGTGYSSLNHIREIPLDVIKVDQSFVKDLEKEDFPQYFIKLVADLAAAIGVKICLEGIETIAQCRVLADMNVCLVQGYYFDRPLPAEVFREKYINKITEASYESINQCIR